MVRGGIRGQSLPPQVSLEEGLSQLSDLVFRTSAS